MENKLKAALGVGLVLFWGGLYGQITIDGDMLDWVGIDPADVGDAAEALGDMPTGPEFDLENFYITSDVENVYCKIDIDPSATFTGGFTNYTNWPVLELWFDVNMGDTTGLGWGGFWVLAGDYRIDLVPAYDPDGPSDEVTIYHYGSDYEGSEEIYDSVGVALVAVNDEDNSIEVAVPRGVINAGSSVRPFVYSVGDEIWDYEDYIPDDQAEGLPADVIDYSFINGVSIVRVRDEEKVSVDDSSPTTIPREYRLTQNYPNPFNPTTTIEYEIPKAGIVFLTVHNLLGQKVATLFSGRQNAGLYQATWNGTTDQGQKVSSGVYFYRLETSSGVNLTRKMLLLQ